MCVRERKRKGAREYLVTSDLCGLGPVAEIHAVAGGKSGGVWGGGHFVDRYVSSAHLFSISSSLPRPTFSLFSWILHSSLYSLCISPFNICKSCSPSVNQPCTPPPSLLPFLSFPPFTYLSSVPAYFPTFLSHGHLPSRKSIFPNLNHCLHHFSPAAISLLSFLWDSQSLSLFPLSKAGVYFCSFLICHCCAPTKRHILLFSLSFSPLWTKVSSYDCLAEPIFSDRKQASHLFSLVCIK